MCRRGRPRRRTRSWEIGRSSERVATPRLAEPERHHRLLGRGRGVGRDCGSRSWCRAASSRKRAGDGRTAEHHSDIPGGNLEGDIVGRRRPPPDRPAASPTFGCRDCRVTSRSTDRGQPAAGAARSLVGTARGLPNTIPPGWPPSASVVYPTPGPPQPNASIVRDRTSMPLGKPPVPALVAEEIAVERAHEALGAAARPARDGGQGDRSDRAQRAQRLRVEVHVRVADLPGQLVDVLRRAAADGRVQARERHHGLVRRRAAASSHRAKKRSSTW